MKPLVNLSINPFRNRRLFWLAILLLFLIPSYFGLQAIKTATDLEGKIAVQDLKTRNEEAKLKLVKKPVVSKLSVSADENRQLVAASELIARRAFSWSQLLNDIERTLPASVRVLRVAVAQIEPRERQESFGGTENAATLGLVVIGKSGQEVTTMINRMHESGRFKVFPMSKKSVEGTEEIEFELKVEYFPPGAPARANTGNQIAASQPETQIAKKVAENR